MTDKILSEVRAAAASFQNCIISSITVTKAQNFVTVNLVTDKAFSPDDKANVTAVLKKYVPAYFTLAVNVSKLTPDCDMVKSKIFEVLDGCSKAVAATCSPEDITVEKTENGFKYNVAVLSSLAPADLCERITAKLKRVYCGEFFGEVKKTQKEIEDVEEEDDYEEEFVIPPRTFEISDFNVLEGDKIQKRAVYLSDLNIAGEEAVICGTIESIRERTYTNKKGMEKSLLSLALNDTTATAYATYFIRQKSAEKIKALKVGDSIVCTGTNDLYNGDLRFTAKTIDYGKIPENFVPEKRESKPVPAHYHFVRPQPFSDIEQTDLFTPREIPACLKGQTFVVFDLETTGLNSSPVTGNMDKIIEIGAFKIIGGEIAESFTTFINPGRKLSEEIINLTGITEEMVKDAPSYEEAMPDFYKFCAGSILVGHNVVGFDFKFVDYYWQRLGYNFPRKLIDTIPLSQELLYLSNYKLNTVAERFQITFNHHRAIDDALTTAKIFIELIKMKKSLPKIQ
ncbi:MAG: hypothetical protein K2L67_01565 [Clostridia bacterium]|nr:hypothetical protein [Clostridia bacterium]